jgi:hypothetical protein
MKWEDLTGNIPLTKLHVFHLTPHKCRRDLQHIPSPVPLPKDPLLEFRVHDVLDTPNIIVLIPWRELLANNPDLLPLPLASFRNDLVSCYSERLEVGILNEPWDDDKSVLVIL